jgi:signal transduction histidine kinase
MVAQSYSNYLAWKDSISEVRRLDETGALKKQIASHEATIADKDSSLTTRQAIIWGLGILAAALAVALVLGALVLMRYILLCRKQKKTIQLANESNALKAKFISNISAQMGPTLEKLDQKQPEVKALISFASHIQTLSDLENAPQSEMQFEETPLQPLCEQLMDQVRGTERQGVTLSVNAPKLSASINREYASHILLHLLRNAVEYTPEGGTVKLDYKKRGAHSHQFIVTDSGPGIPEEQQGEIFKPFREIKDLTTGDGLGLPTCKQMALRMNGDLEIDPQYTRGTRFLLDLHS